MKERLMITTATTLNDDTKVISNLPSSIALVYRQQHLCLTDYSFVSVHLTLKTKH